MNGMKGIISCIMTAIVLMGTLTACGSVSGVTAAEGDNIRIVTTIFPEYDWVMNVLGENPANAEVTMLLDNGVDMHSYQPTADDILRVSACDLFIYVGGESDAWANDALQESMNKDKVVINLMDVLGDSVKEEEIVEGMQAEEHEGAEGGVTDAGAGEPEVKAGSEEETEYDEHVWLSLRNAATCVRSISDAMGDVDPDNADFYRDNASEYVDKLKSLDDEYEAMIRDSSCHTLLFGDRFPFRYLTDDYGLDYYAAFAGCYAEAEASFETIVFLSNKADELSLGSILTIEGTDHRIAEAIRDNTASGDQQILTLNSMQSATLEDASNGTSYLSVMTNNLSVLTEALR